MSGTKTIILKISLFEDGSLGFRRIDFINELVVNSSCREMITATISKFNDAITTVIASAFAKSIHTINVLTTVIASAYAIFTVIPFDAIFVVTLAS